MNMKHMKKEEISLSGGFNILLKGSFSDLLHVPLGQHLKLYAHSDP